MIPGRFILRVRSVLFRSLLLTFALAAGICLAQEAKPLKNADIKQMVAAGIGDDTIVVVIRSRRCEFDTSVDALIDLKNANVSQRIIGLMLAGPQPGPAKSEAVPEVAKSKPAVNTPPTSPGKIRYSPGTLPGGWEAAGPAPPQGTPGSGMESAGTQRLDDGHGQYRGARRNLRISRFPELPNRVRVQSRESRGR